MSEAYTFANGVRIRRDHLLPVQLERYAAGVNLHEPVEEGWIVRLVGGLPPALASFVDVGAAVGYYCILVRRLDPAVAVHAYEPDALNRERLLENAALNGVEGVRIHPEAVGSFAGKSVLVGEGYTGFLSSEPGAAGTTVATTTIDDIVRDVGRIGLLKMDIQGGEVKALEGAAKALRGRSVANWVIGTHSAALHEQCLAGLRRNDYRILFDSLIVDQQPDGLVVAASGRR